MKARQVANGSKYVKNVISFHLKWQNQRNIADSLSEMKFIICYSIRFQRIYILPVNLSFTHELQFLGKIFFLKICKNTKIFKNQQNSNKITEKQNERKTKKQNIYWQIKHKKKKNTWFISWALRFLKFRQNTFHYFFMFHFILIYINSSV